MSIVQDQPLVPPTDLFPFRAADGGAPGGTVRPFGATLAGLGSSVTVGSRPNSEEVELGYSHTLQVSTIDGHPTVATASGQARMVKKENTVHDTQTDTQEVER